MPQQLVTRSEFARMAGVSPAAVTQACSRGELGDAMHGRRIDAAHARARAYLKRNRKNGRTKVAAPVETPVLPASSDGEIHLAGVTPEDAALIADLTTREVVRRFGTMTQFRDWLDSLKRIEEIREKRIKNDEATGRLIPREPVKAYVFAAIDAVNRRLLSDAPKSIAARLDAMTKSGATLEERELVVRELIGSQLKPVRDQAMKSLRGD